MDDKKKICYHVKSTWDFLSRHFVKRILRESLAIKVVHTLKEKVELFALQKLQSWDAQTVRLIRKKQLAYGLKKFKETEIPKLVDSESLLRQSLL